MKLDNLIDTIASFEFSKKNLNRWPSLKIDHSFKKKKERDLKNVYSLIKEAINKKNNPVKGIYIYFDNSTCLYVGKSVNIASRIYSHYKESQNLFGSPDWRKFFKSHGKKLQIYFYEIELKNLDEGESVRIIIERLLILRLSPLFEKYHKSRK